MASSDWWVQIRIDLVNEPEVYAIAAALGLSRYDVVGRLISFWGWAKRVTRTGVIRHVDARVIDAHVGVTGFVTALEKVAWLERDESRLIIPRFERYFLPKTERQKELARLRSRKYREKKKRDASRASRDVTVARRDGQQNRTEQNKTISLPPTPLSEGGEKESVLASPSKAKDEVPPMPSRSAKPADNPEMFEVARRIIKFYDRVVGSTWPQGNAPEVLIEQLLRGRTEAQLCRAAQGYAAHCERHGTLARYRMGVSKFYGSSSCDQFLDYQPPDPQAEQRARDAEILRRREEDRRKKEQTRKSGGTVRLGDVLPKLLASKEGDGACPK